MICKPSLAHAGAFHGDLFVPYVATLLLKNFFVGV